MSRINELFGSMVFNDSVMKDRLPHDTYKAFKKNLADGTPLDRSIADVVANAMKDWAIEKGATHFTHWFQPMTSITAEKHEAFIAPDGDGVILEFSGKELIKGESDASSFPSGGLRATFEARGYTAWDPTSYAFIKGNTLCIPTAFCSYTGEALDKKTPLLRSMDAVNVQALRILHLFGRDNVTHVTPTAGAEQEYFLISRDLYNQRPDLRYTNRTLFGARPPKGQELADQYFGALKERVSGYMRDLDEELWKLGVLARTEHNEAAPAQHELAPIFSNCNAATDQNQLTMEMMKKVAKRHNMVCLLHEKPFASVSGSGKHNNWSLSTDTGANLFDPGSSPSENVQFLLFLAAVIKAVDEYQDLLRIVVASAGNDHRLGASEAPPAIVSIFLGDELNSIIEAMEKQENYDPNSTERAYFEMGVKMIPNFPKDSTDRNRTSPFAFTGNKFEFRMPGSSFSVAGPNTVLNTIVAEALRQFADELERSDDFKHDVYQLIRRTICEHKRIIFNGNNYADEWVAEAERRGLSNYRSTADAVPHYTDRKNVELFERHGVYTETELQSRRDILLENYCKVVHIEALTMLDMVNRQILPAVLEYSSKLSNAALTKKQIGVPCALEIEQATRLSERAAAIYELAGKLDAAVKNQESGMDEIASARYHRDVIFFAMQDLRAVVDETELLVSADCWPYPSYGELLFSIR